MPAVVGLWCHLVYYAEHVSTRPCRYVQSILTRLAIRSLLNLKPKQMPVFYATLTSLSSPTFNSHQFDKSLSLGIATSNTAIALDRDATYPLGTAP